MIKKVSKDQREFPRAKRVLSVQYRLCDTRKADVAWYLSTTQDMSVSGLTFHTDLEFKIKDKLEIRVVMSGILEIFKGYTQVVRIDRKRTGSPCVVAVKFIEKKSRPITVKRSIKRTIKKISSRKKY